ncbi:hypothetical protein BST61_g8657 [Cercospora zeina]
MSDIERIITGLTDLVNGLRDGAMAHVTGDQRVQTLLLELIGEGPEAFCEQVVQRLHKRKWPSQLPSDSSAHQIPKLTRDESEKITGYREKDATDALLCLRRGQKDIEGLLGALEALQSFQEHPSFVVKNRQTAALRE